MEKWHPLERNDWHGYPEICKKGEFDFELQRLVAKRQRPKQIFYQVVQYLKAHRIALPRFARHKGEFFTVGIWYLLGVQQLRQTNIF